jgi:hypothetical protein
LALATPISATSGVTSIFGGTYESGTVSGTATLNVLGGSIATGNQCVSGADVRLADTASINVISGSVGCIYAQSQGWVPFPYLPDISVNVFGGHVEQIWSYLSNTTINIFGGEIDHIHDSSSAFTMTNLYGGSIGRISSTYEEGTYNFFGYGFEVLPDPTARDRNILRGFWSDGTPFETNLRGDDSQWSFRFCSLETCDVTQRSNSVSLYTVAATVPEPGSVALLAAALFAIGTRRRTASRHHAT